MAAALANHLPIVIFKCPDEALAGNNRLMGDSRRERNLPADHTGLKRLAVFAEALDIEENGLARIRHGVIEVNPLSVEARKFGGIDVVPALFLRLEDQLDFFAMSAI